MIFRKQFIIQLLFKICKAFLFMHVCVCECMLAVPQRAGVLRAGVIGSWLASDVDAGNRTLEDQRLLPAAQIYSRCVGKKWKRPGRQVGN